MIIPGKDAGPAGTSLFVGNQYANFVTIISHTACFGWTLSVM